MDMKEATVTLFPLQCERNVFFPRISWQQPGFSVIEEGHKNQSKINIEWIIFNLFSFFNLAKKPTPEINKK